MKRHRKPARVRTPLISVLIDGRGVPTPLEEALRQLQRSGVAFEVKVVPPERRKGFIERFAAGASRRGVSLVMAAGGDTLLALTAAHTTLPVIMVPTGRARVSGTRGVAISPPSAGVVIGPLSPLQGARLAGQLAKLRGFAVH